MQKTKGKKVRKIIGWMIFLSLAIFFAGFFVLQAISPRLPLDIVGIGFFMVAPTQSMEPELKANDLIIVRRANFDELKVGDTVTFMAEARQNGEAVTIAITHNIVGYQICSESGEKGFVTRGINARGRDALYMTADGAAFNGQASSNVFVGVVSSSSSFLGNLFAYFRSPHAMVSAILNMFILMIIYLLIKPEKIKDNKNKEY